MNALPPLAALALVACTDPAFETTDCRDHPDRPCEEIPAEEPQALLDAVNTLDDDAVLVLGAGSFALDNQVTVRAEGITLVGQGLDVTVLDFADQAAQSNGVDVVGDRFTIEGLTILDAKKDGLRIEDSDRIVIRGVKATWTNENDPDNGAYGLYPVRVSNVLLEQSEAWNAADAGIYVGQCRHAIVRDNVAKQNVAGFEIENTQFADVYGNLAEDNTGGLVVFDLPGNPVIGRDIVVHDNEIVDNNRPNFAPGGTVRQIPAGTGTFALASRRVEIRGNTYRDNGTVDIALLSGLVVEDDPTAWLLEPSELVGDPTGLDLDVDSETGAVMNFRTQQILVEDNTHTGGGTAVDGGDPQTVCLTNPSSEDCTRPLGALLAVTWGEDPVDSVLYDTIGESAFHPTDPAQNSNDNHLCIGAGDGGTFASLDLPSLAGQAPPSTDDVFQPAAPFTPFDCTALTGGPVPEITVESP